MRLRTFIIGTALLAVSDASAAKKANTIVPDSDVPFSVEDAAWAKAPGNNSIVGNAMLRTVGGDVKTCAGFAAQLVPRTSYGESRLIRIYGSSERGFMAARTPLQIAPAKPEYSQIIKSTTCDSEGRFKFTGLPDGIYYISATVTWGVPGRYFTRTEGGLIMQKVEVKNDETKEVVLTN